MPGGGRFVDRRAGGWALAREDVMAVRGGAWGDSAAALPEAAGRLQVTLKKLAGLD